jgi:predicted DNA-binding transcriptional regulator AlpA
MWPPFWMRQAVANSHMVIESDMRTEIEPPLTSDDVAELLNVSPRTLHRWGRLKKGPPSIKIGRAVFYRRAAVESWLLALETIADNGATVARFRK